MLRSFFCIVSGFIALVGCAASTANQSACSQACAADLSQGPPKKGAVDAVYIIRDNAEEHSTCSGPVEDMTATAMETDRHFIPLGEGVNPITKTKVHGHTFIRHTNGERETVFCTFKDGCYPPKTGLDDQCEDRTRCCVLKTLTVKKLKTVDVEL